MSERRTLATTPSSPRQADSRERKRLDDTDHADSDQLNERPSSRPPLRLRRKSQPLVTTIRAGASSKRSSISSLSLPEEHDTRSSSVSPTPSEVQLRQRFARPPSISIQPYAQEELVSLPFVACLPPTTRPVHRRAQSTPPVLVTAPDADRPSLQELQRKRAKAVLELCDTEAAYVAVLAVIEENFLKPLQTSLNAQEPIITDKAIREIFANFTQIAAIARQMLAVLEQLRPDGAGRTASDSPGKLIRPIIPFLKAYSLFLLNFDQSRRCIQNEELANPAFAALCMKFKQRGVGKGLDLSALLLSIPQRIPRYTLLLQNILRYTPASHPDRPDLEDAFRAVEHIASQNNETIREHENAVALVELQRSFVGLDFALVEPGRRLLKSGRMMIVTRRGEEQRAFFLFNDMLLEATVAESAWPRPISVLTGLGELANRTSALASSTTSFAATQYALEHRYWLPQLDVYATSKHCFELSTRTLRVAVTFDRQEDKEGWLQALRDAKRDCLASRASLQTTDASDTPTSPRKRPEIESRRLSLPALAVRRPSLAVTLSSLQLDPRTPSHVSGESSSSDSSSVFSFSPPTFVGSLPFLESYRAPVLVPDNSSSRCTICRTEFTMVRRRHHCALCGRLLCSRCSARIFTTETDASDSRLLTRRSCEPTDNTDDNSVDAAVTLRVHYKALHDARLVPTHGRPLNARTLQVRGLREETDMTSYGEADPITSPFDLAKSMRAVVHQGDEMNVKVEQVDLPSLEPEEILVRVKAIGLNPTDYKHAQYFSSKGERSGCDFSGEVAAFGPSVPIGLTPFKQNSRVFGFVRGANGNKRSAAFAEYVAVPYDNLTILPDNISFEDGASLPIPAYTAVQGLYLRLKLPEPVQSPKKEWFLVWAGASSVGQYAIQLAKLSGYHVVTTASPQNWDLMKKLGAEAVFDYKDDGAVDKILKITDGALEYAFDCVSTDESLQKVSFAIRKKGGHVVPVLFPDVNERPRKEVDVHLNLAYVMLQSSGTVSFGPQSFESSKEEHDFYVQWHPKLTKLLEDGHLKTMPVKSHGGLEDVAEGMKFMSEGKNRAYKMVFTV